MALNPCIANTDCIDLSLDGSDNLQATLNISPLGCNAAVCRPDGLYVIEHKSLVQAGINPMIPGSSPPVFPGWEAELDDLTIDVPALVANGDTGVQTFTNPSECYPCNLIITVASREVQYAGTEGAQFLVSFKGRQNLNGGGWTAFDDTFNILSDYRFYSPGLIFDRRAGGASTGCYVIDPGSTYLYEFRIEITKLANATSPGAVVGSAGMEWGFLGVA